MPCAICLERYRDGEVSRLSCGHRFHTQCIGRAFHMYANSIKYTFYSTITLCCVIVYCSYCRRPNCPLCRRRFRVEMAIRQDVAVNGEIIQFVTPRGWTIRHCIRCYEIFFILPGEVIGRFDRCFCQQCRANWANPALSLIYIFSWFLYCNKNIYPLIQSSFKNKSS